MKSTGYPLHSPVSPFTSPPARHRVPSYFNCSIPRMLHQLCRMIEIMDEVSRAVKTSHSSFHASQFEQPMTAHNSIRVTITIRHTSCTTSRRHWYIGQAARKTKSGFCACAITFQTQSNKLVHGISQDMLPQQTVAWHFVHVAEIPKTPERAVHRVLRWNYGI